MNKSKKDFQRLKKVVRNRTLPQKLEQNWMRNTGRDNPIIALNNILEATRLRRNFILWLAMQIIVIFSHIVPHETASGGLTISIEGGLLLTVLVTALTLMVIISGLRAAWQSVSTDQNRSLVNDFASDLMVLASIKDFDNFALLFERVKTMHDLEEIGIRDLIRKAVEILKAQKADERYIGLNGDLPFKGLYDSLNRLGVLRQKGYNFFYGEAERLLEAEKTEAEADSLEEAKEQV